MSDIESLKNLIDMDLVNVEETEDHDAVILRPTIKGDIAVLEYEVSQLKKHQLLLLVLNIISIGFIAFLYFM